MIVVDSSVWIAHLRNLHVPAVQKLRAIKPLSRIILGDLILFEVLQGARDDHHAARLERDLRTYQILPMLNASRAANAAGNYRLLRGHGVTIRRTVDMVIGTFCIDHGFELLHQDRDFAPMEKHLGLRIA